MNGTSPREAPDRGAPIEAPLASGLESQPTPAVDALLAGEPPVVASGVAPQPVESAARAAATEEPFVLPLGTLEAVAEAAGLQWINSDAEKIRAVQEAMANEPVPPRIPRERKAPVVIDEGPLVLVETRKDLS